MVLRGLLFGVGMLPLLLLGTGEKPYFTINFNKASKPWRARPGEKGGKAKSALTRSGGYRQSPALIWYYELNEKVTPCVYSCLVPARVLPRKPLKMSFCIRGNNSNTLLGFRLRDATGRIWQQNLTTIDFEGWRTIEVDIKPAGYAWGGKSRPDNGFTYPITLLEFTLDLKPDKPYYKTKGKIILDEFLFYERQYENF